VAQQLGADHEKGVLLHGKMSFFLDKSLVFQVGFSGI
jgi:hypothetical protein